MKIQIYCFFLAAAILFQGCAGPTEGLFPSSYYKLRENALGGDERSICSILKYASKTDGEQRLSYGDTLLKIKEKSGNEQFNKCLSELSSDKRQEILDILVAVQNNKELIKRFSE